MVLHKDEIITVKRMCRKTKVLRHILFTLSPSIGNREKH